MFYRQIENEIFSKILDHSGGGFSGGHRWGILGGRQGLIAERFSPIRQKKIAGGMLVVRGPKQELSDKILLEIQCELGQLFKNGTLQSVSYEEDISFTYVFHKTKKENVAEAVSKMITS